MVQLVHAVRMLQACVSSRPPGSDQDADFQFFCLNVALPSQPVDRVSVIREPGPVRSLNSLSAHVLNRTHKRCHHTARYDRAHTFHWAVRSAQIVPFSLSIVPLAARGRWRPRDHAPRLWLACFSFRHPDGLDHACAGDPVLPGHYRSVRRHHAPMEDEGFHAALVCLCLRAALDRYRTGQSPESL